MSVVMKRRVIDSVSGRGSDAAKQVYAAVK